MDYWTYFKRSVAAFRRRPLAYLWATWTFNSRKPPSDPDKRELWRLAGEGEYQTQRNVGWVFAYFVTPLFGVLTVVGFVYAVTRGGGEWAVFAIVFSGFLGFLLNARAWRRGARELKARLEAGDPSRLPPSP